MVGRSKGPRGARPFRSVGSAPLGGARWGASGGCAALAVGSGCGETNALLGLSVLIQGPRFSQMAMTPHGLPPRNSAGTVTERVYTSTA